MSQTARLRHEDSTAAERKTLEEFVSIATPACRQARVSVLGLTPRSQAPDTALE